MDDLMIEWEEAKEAGETDLDWEDWYIDRCAQAYDRAKDAWKDRGVP